MANRTLNFDDACVKVLGRDDGVVMIEFRDNEDLVVEGTISLNASVAVSLGKLLVVKGQSILDQLQAIADRATAWRDRNRQVWVGEKGADRLVPYDADDDLVAHSWEELEKYFGPLTAVVSQ